MQGNIEYYLTEPNYNFKACPTQRLYRSYSNLALKIKDRFSNQAESIKFYKALIMMTEERNLQRQ
jgi:hypothetical protein